MFRNLLHSIARAGILFYSIKIPYHRGKWRVVEGLLRLSGVEKMDMGKTFIVERREIRWKLNTGCAVQRRLFYHGGFDNYDIRELTARLGDDSVFLDVGSYFGYYSLEVARRTHGLARVFAFEPVPANYRLLMENIGLNEFKNIRGVQLAVSDIAGEVRFEIPPDDNRGIGKIATDGDAPELLVTVNATTLDQFVEEQGIARLDAMKIDVEGAEVRVLRGARASIRKFRPVMVIELNPPCLQRFGSSQEELIGAIRELGYEIYRARPAGLKKFDGLESGEIYVNIFCLPGKAR
jgi:FkbM family methyltransferase